MAQTDEAMFYQLYFQEPGVAEAEFERDVRDTMRRMLYRHLRRHAAGASATAFGMVPRKGGFLSRMADPATPAAWLSEDDIDFYAASSRAPDSAAASTGTATSTATGSCSRRSRGAR